MCFLHIVRYTCHSSGFVFSDEAKKQEKICLCATQYLLCRILYNNGYTISYLYYVILNSKLLRSKGYHLNFFLTDVLGLYIK